MVRGSVGFVIFLVNKGGGLLPNNFSSALAVRYKATEGPEGLTLATLLFIDTIPLIEFDASLIVLSTANEFSTEYKQPEVKIAEEMKPFERNFLNEILLAK